MGRILFQGQWRIVNDIAHEQDGVTIKLLIPPKAVGMIIDV